MILYNVVKLYVEKNLDVLKYFRLLEMSILWVGC